MNRSSKNSIALILCCLLIKLPGLAQANATNWEPLFNAPFSRNSLPMHVLLDSMHHLKPDGIYSLIRSFENNKKYSGTDEGMVKINLLKSMYCHHLQRQYDDKDWSYWGEKSITQSAATGNEGLVMSCCLILGDAYLSRNNYDTAIFYLLKTVELAQQLEYNDNFITSNKIAVSNALYRTQNYRQCIDFCKTSADIESVFSPITVITAYNNTGLSYIKLDMPDSAIYFFSKAASFAHSKQWYIWEGIALGNIGDAWHAKGDDEKAMPYWRRDYDSSIRYNEPGNAGLTMAYISQYEFNHGQQQQAIRQLQWAASVNSKDDVNMLRIYKIMSDCYRKAGYHDSADYFLERHYQLSDSINQVVNRNNYNTVELRMAFEKNNHEFTVLQKERQAEVSRRNLLLVALLASLTAGILLYNRQRLRTQLARKEKEIAESEINSAREQLSIFTQTLLEKNEQIEKLTRSLEQQQLASNDELIHQTLLTDYDWNRFKELFEKTNPDFFNRLRTKAPAITQSEMRLAALIKLNLDNKQMASMQGISVSSLRGNKTRLRQKLNISADTDLEMLIKQL